MAILRLLLAGFDKTSDSKRMHETENEKGSGLGLILCKEFIEKNGGSLTVDSSKGTGSKFSFTLPLAPKPA